MSLFSVANLDKPMPCCGLPLREHCVPADGGWLYSPCESHLLRRSDLSDEWRERFAEHGVCDLCSRTLWDHFARQYQQTVILGRLVGTGAVLVPLIAFVGCPIVEL